MQIRKNKLNYYLQPGKQTEITPVVMQHANNIISEQLDRMPFLDLWNPEFASLIKTGNYLSNMPSNINTSYRNRTASQILSDWEINNPSEFSITFRTLLIAQGVPAIYAEALHEKYISGSEFKNKSLIEVIARNPAKEYDKTSGISEEDDLIKLIILPKKEPEQYTNEQELYTATGFLIFKKGLDSWDLGIKSDEDLQKLLKHQFKKIT